MKHLRLVKSQEKTALTGLVSRAQSGCSDAKEELVSLSQQGLRRHIGKMVKGNDSLAQDLLQETYLRAFQELGRLNDPESFFSWLTACSRNLYVDQLRSPSNRNPHLDIENVDSSLEPIVNVEELNLAVQSTLDKLEPKTRQILVLIDLQGYSYAEVAKRLRISESAVRSRLHRARQCFQSFYTEAA